MALSYHSTRNVSNAMRRPWAEPRAPDLGPRLWGPGWQPDLGCDDRLADARAQGTFSPSLRWSRAPRHSCTGSGDCFFRFFTFSRAPAGPPGRCEPQGTQRFRRFRRGVVYTSMLANSPRHCQGDLFSPAQARCAGSGDGSVCTLGQTFPKVVTQLVREQIDVR